MSSLCARPRHRVSLVIILACLTVYLSPLSRIYSYWSPIESPSHRHDGRHESPTAQPPEHPGPHHPETPRHYRGALGSLGGLVQRREDPRDQSRLPRRGQAAPAQCRYHLRDRIDYETLHGLGDRYPGRRGPSGLDDAAAGGAARVPPPRSLRGARVDHL